MAEQNHAHGPFTIPSLDGIRAVAVLVVFIGHGFTAPGIWPGHVGVTIFFFLSGYLITTLLRREYERSGRISLGKFYLRRLLRITPPALIAIALATVVGMIGLLPSSISIWGVLAEVFNVTNYYIVLFGHEGLPPESSMLWSLAVEEHFYLIFPAVLIVLLRRRLTYKRIAGILVIAAALAPIWRTVLFANDASFYRLYVSTDTRFDGLIIGAAMALVFNPALGDRPPLKLSEKTMTNVLAPIGAVVFAATSILPDPLRLTVADTIQYLCIIPLFWLVIARPSGLTGRILNNRIVAHIGVLSFSIYLLHRLFLGLSAQLLGENIAADAVALLLSLAGAQIIRVLVEKPLGRARKTLESGVAKKSVTTAS